MAAASNFARVVYLDSVVPIRLDATILNWDIAEAATAKHLGQRQAADVPSRCISLRGPVAADSKPFAIAALSILEEADLVALADRDVLSPWYLLKIDGLPAGVGARGTGRGMKAYFRPYLFCSSCDLSGSRQRGCEHQICRQEMEEGSSATPTHPRRLIIPHIAISTSAFAGGEATSRDGGGGASTDAGEFEPWLPLRGRSILCTFDSPFLFPGILVKLEQMQREQCAQRELMMRTEALLVAATVPRKGGFSGASLELRDAALRERGIALLPTRVTDYEGYAGPVDMPAFDLWHKYAGPASLPSDPALSAPAFARASADVKHSEEDATQSLLQHFREHVQLPAGTHVVDVHATQCLFALRVRAPATHIRGSTDGCVCDTANTGLDAHSAARAAVCLIELKTPEALRDFSQKCESQAILELLGASTLCSYPMPVVLTSLIEPVEGVPGIRIFALDGNVVRDFLGAGGGPMTVAEAHGVLLALLPRTLAARKKYIAAKLASVPELGLHDDEDDGGGDSDDLGDDEGDEYVPPPF